MPDIGGLARRIGSRSRLAGAAAVVLAAVLAASGGGPAAATGAAVTVVVDPASAGQVGAGFAGFSYEKNELGAGLFNSGNTNVVRLFRLLGPNVLRIGGNTNDRINWNPHGAGGSATEVAPADVTRLAGFAKATGWQVIYGINLKTNTPANAVSEARFATQALGSSLMALEIGNEPNVYDTEAAYESSYASYTGAIRAALPHAVFDGPGEADSTGWVPTFAPTEKPHGLGLLSAHMYIGNQTTGTIAGMLASNAAGRLPDAEAAMGQAATHNKIPQWRMTETNSYYGGGKAGVSDTEAAALWSLDYLDGVAAHGGAGVNFHGGGGAAYTPIVYSGVTPTGVQGVYYGQLLWVLAGTGPLHAATVTGGSAVTAWGIGNNVFVNNKGSASIRTSVTLAASASTAHEYVLTGPSLSGKAMTIAGSAVGASGTFTPAPRKVAVSGHTVTIDVPAGSAALVTTG